MRNTKIYNIWNRMKQRCNGNEERCKDWKWRGITYNPKWETFEWFFEDMQEWYMIWLSLDRIDNNKWYYKENCKWSNRSEQMRNTRRAKIYKWKPLMQWIEELWLKKSTITERLRRGWTYAQALWLEEKEYVRPKWLKYSKN